MWWMRCCRWWCVLIFPGKRLLLLLLLPLLLLHCSISHLFFFLLFGVQCSSTCCSSFSSSGDSYYHHVPTIDQVILIWGLTFANSVVVNLATKMVATIGYHCYHYQHPLDSPIPADWYVSPFGDDYKTTREPPLFPCTNDRLVLQFLH